MAGLAGVCCRCVRLKSHLLFCVVVAAVMTCSVLADQLLSFFKVHPQLLFDHMADIIDFLAALRNIGRAGEEFFSHMVSAS